MALGVFVATTLLALAPLEQSQAQLYIHIYPSQDSPTNQTLWIFSGSSTAKNSSTIRTGAPNSNSPAVWDSWEFSASHNSGNFFNVNNPNEVDDVIASLSPLFSSSNSKDIASVRARIPSGGKTNITFLASATNTPTITIGSGNRTIAHLYLDADNGPDELGIRVSGSNLSYSTGNSSTWVGSGILNKPIGDFHAGTFNNKVGTPNGPWFAANSNGSMRVVVNSQIIPEPEEYALLFGLFALVFVIVQRRFLQKHTEASG